MKSFVPKRLSLKSFVAFAQSFASTPEMEREWGGNMERTKERKNKGQCGDVLFGKNTVSDIIFLVFRIHFAAKKFRSDCFRYFVVKIASVFSKMISRNQRRAALRVVPHSLALLGERNTTQSFVRPRRSVLLALDRMDQTNNNVPSLLSAFDLKHEAVTTLQKTGKRRRRKQRESTRHPRRPICRQRQHDDDARNVRGSFSRRADKSRYYESYQRSRKRGDYKD